MNKLENRTANGEEWQKKKLHCQITDDGSESYFWFGLHFINLD